MEIVLRATVIFVFLLALLKALGKRELSDLTAFDLVLLNVIGDLVQQGVTQEDMSLTGAVLAVGTIGLWVVALSYASFRWPRTRPIIDGTAVVIARDGELMTDALRFERMAAADVLAAAREQGIDRMSDVRCAVLEPDGRMSFLLNDAVRNRNDAPRRD